MRREKIGEDGATVEDKSEEGIVQAGREVKFAEGAAHFFLLGEDGRGGGGTPGEKRSWTVSFVGTF